MESKTVLHKETRWITQERCRLFLQDSSFSDVGLKERIYPKDFQVTARLKVYSVPELRRITYDEAIRQQVLIFILIFSLKIQKLVNHLVQVGQHIGLLLKQLYQKNGKGKLYIFYGIPTLKLFYGKMVSHYKLLQVEMVQIEELNMK